MTYSTLSLQIMLFLWINIEIKGFLGGSNSKKKSACNAGDAGSISMSGRSPGKGMIPTPIFLPGEFHGQRSLADYSLRCCRVGHDWATNIFTFRKIRTVNSVNLQHTHVSIQKSMAYLYTKICTKRKVKNIVYNSIKNNKSW